MTLVDVEYLYRCSFQPSGFSTHKQNRQTLNKWTKMGRDRSDEIPYIRLRSATAIVLDFRLLCLLY